LVVGARVERDAFEAARGWALDALRLATDESSVREATRKGELFDVVTTTDGRIERYLRDQVRTRFPDHGFLGEEEGGGNGSHPWQWVVDPIDGTLNYSTALPGSACSIALLSDGQPVVGAIADYSAGRTYRAIAGSGTVLVGGTADEDVARPTSSRAGGARIFLEFGWEDLDPVTVGVIEELAALRTRVIRMIGGAAAALVNVALYGGCMFGLGLRIWDVAAGIVIAQEAGRQIRRWDEGSLVHLIVGSAQDIEELAPVIERFRASRVPPHEPDAR
jgi:myo-inositol-1(or 4)-monophosphatase